MPYTYLIKFIPDGRVYYGVRYRSGCHPEELLVDYMTSSKEVKKLIEKHGVEAFEKQIRRVFDSPQKAREWETRVLNRINAAGRKEFLNKNNNTPSKGKRGKSKPEKDHDGYLDIMAFEDELNKHPMWVRRVTWNAFKVRWMLDELLAIPEYKEHS